MHSKTIYLWNANYHFDQLLNSEQRVKSILMITILKIAFHEFGGRLPSLPSLAYNSVVKGNKTIVLIIKKGKENLHAQMSCIWYLYAPARTVWAQN